MSNFHYDGLPIYQIGTAKAANPSYFKHIPTTRPGTTKAILGKIIGDLRGNCSYMLVRRSEREPHYSMQQQGTKYGEKPNYYQRALYKIRKSDYVIVRQNWADGSIKELEAFSTPTAARDVFKRIAGRGYTSKFTTSPT